MADKPILFSPAMAHAVLIGRKTMTSRLLQEGAALPFSAGDTMWVRETHYRTGYWQQYLDVKMGDKSKLRWRFVALTDHVQFDLPKYCTEPPQGVPRDNHSSPKLYRRPARFMFKHHARQHLLVEECVARRLHDIPDYDLAAEGIVAISKDGKTRKFGIPDRDGLPGTDDFGWPWIDWCATQRDAFRCLWNDIHGPGAYELNPLVSSTRFKMRQPDGIPPHSNGERR